MAFSALHPLNGYNWDNVSARALGVPAFVHRLGGFWLELWRQPVLLPLPDEAHCPEFTVTLWLSASNALRTQVAVELLAVGLGGAVWVLVAGSIE
jgi:hypothetical protein